MVQSASGSWAVDMSFLFSFVKVIGCNWLITLSISLDPSTSFNILQHPFRESVSNRSTDLTGKNKNQYFPTCRPSAKTSSRLQASSATACWNPEPPWKSLKPFGGMIVYPIFKHTHICNPWGQMPCGDLICHGLRKRKVGQIRPAR